jgi:Zn-dependent protease
MIWVAAAGPLTNLSLAVVSGLLFQILVFLGSLLPSGGGALVKFFIDMAVVSVQFNALLALFNLIPLPPLDGGRILTGILPREQAIAVSRIEPYGMFLLVLMIALNPLGITTGLWRLVAALTRALLGY